ncbi:MAG: hypothetical protein PHN44_01175 [Candidatus Marinimicrobia bacterium]|nr:hypothetical protein [Candidatus Neomarinimicrobiota bacterium]MDD5539095.1 hypothetical protein [Candidatus Neomarinimicrobiota bacterium]
MAEKKIGEVEVLFSRNACPLCGCERAAYKDTVEQEIAAGRFGTEVAEMGIGEITTPGLVIDPTKNVLAAPQITVVSDYCLNKDCGAKYVSKIIRVRVQVSVQFGPPQGPRGGAGPGFQFRPQGKG